MKDLPISAINCWKLCVEHGVIGFVFRYGERTPNRSSAYLVFIFLSGMDDVARVPTVLVRSRRDLSHIKYIPRVLLDANKVQKWNKHEMCVRGFFYNVVTISDRYCYKRYFNN